MRRVLMSGQEADREDACETMRAPIRLVLPVAVAALAVAAGAYVALGSRPGGTMLGVVTRSGTASLKVSDQLGASTDNVVDEVRAPGDSWLVAYRIGMEGMPGALLGYTHIGPGESRQVRIPLDVGVRLTPVAIVALHTDRGVRGAFEFDTARFEASPDKPYYIDGLPVEATATVALPENGDTFPMPASPPGL